MIQRTHVDRAHFVVERTHELSTLGARLTAYRHPRSGARHLHVDNGDGVKAMLIGLPTPAVDDSGLTHVLEHLLLCGGRGFPARRAFFQMLWRSACLTMNASAEVGVSSYHFATHHRRDFDNLLAVYLDCLFQPRLDRADFLQEGHRVEPAGAGQGHAAPVHRGVVYNEMLGAMQLPAVQLETALARHLYAGSSDAWNSGGDPQALLRLRYEDVVAYHRRVFRPGNALFLSAGDIPPVEVQTRIAAHACEGSMADLSSAASADALATMSAPVTVREAPPVGGRAQIVVAWRLGERADPRAVLEARVLEALLLGVAGAPFRAVLDGGRFTGRASPQSGLQDAHRVLSLRVALEDADPGQAPAFEAALIEALATALRGADAAAAAVDRVERALREAGTRHHPHGLAYLARLLVPVLHGGDPAAHLDPFAALESLRCELAVSGRLETLIGERLITNPARLTLVLDPAASPRAVPVPAPKPEPVLKASDDATDYADTLPVLAIADLDPVPGVANARVESGAGLTIYSRSAPCSGLTHLQMAVPLPPLAPRTISALLALAAVLDDRAGSGDVETAVTVRCSWDDRRDASVVLVLSAASLTRYHDALAARIHAMLDAAVLPAADSLAILHENARARLRAQLLARGHAAMEHAAAAAFGGAGALLDHVEGPGALVALGGGPDVNGVSGLAASLDALLRHVRNAPRLLQVVTDAESLDDACTAARAPWRGRAPLAQGGFRPWSVDEPGGPDSRRFSAPLAVGHAARVHAGVAPGHADAAALAVLGPLLTAGGLHARIRDRGGAYGAGARYCLARGHLAAFSFRDPCPLDTLAVFETTMNALAVGTPARETLERAKLAVLRELDASHSPAQRATHLFLESVHGRTPQRLAAFRDRVLAVEPVDIVRAVEAHVLRTRAATAVLANEGLLRSGATHGLRIESLA